MSAAPRALGETFSLLQRMIEDLFAENDRLRAKLSRPSEALSAQIEASVAWAKECELLNREIVRLHKCLDDAREGYEHFIAKINADVKAKAEAKTDVSVFTDLEKRVAALKVELEDTRKLKEAYRNYWHEEAEKAERLAREVAALRQENANLRGEMRTASREIDATTACLRGHRIVTGPIVREHLGNLTDLARPELCDQPPCWCHDEARKLTAWLEGAASGPRRLHLGRRGLSGYYFGCDNDSCWCHEPSPVPRP